MRRKLIAGNWKMHGDSASVEQLLSGLHGALADTPAEVAVCPTYVHLTQALAQCEGSVITVGGQDCSHMPSGAYTGEVAAVRKYKPQDCTTNPSLVLKATSDPASEALVMREIAAMRFKIST